MVWTFDGSMNNNWARGVTERSDSQSPTQAAHALQTQRLLAERLLLSALRDHDAADVAEVLRRDASWLAAETKRLADSLDEPTTLRAMAHMSLPHLGSWCIIDTLGEDGAMRRIDMVHPDPAMQAKLDVLSGRWVPHPGDPFGLPATVRAVGPIVIEGPDVGAAISASARDADVDAILATLGIAAMMTVPLSVRDEVIGAVTFVATRANGPFSDGDFRLADDLADRAAMALDRARIYGDAVEHRTRAEAATKVKSEFLGMMSHELRTPLNAIGGYLDLLDMEIHGPINENQRVDINRIRFNQRYLTGLISDLLNLTKVGTGLLRFEVSDVLAADVITGSVALVEPVAEKRQLTLSPVLCPADTVIRGDRERITQIMVNLLSNAIKFTPVGGRIDVACTTTETQVRISVTDTGIGIPAEKLESIFEAFVQVTDHHQGPEAGIGLGLAISRGLAQGMGGQLTVESTLGKGTSFMLHLPRSIPDRLADDSAALGAER